MSPPRMRSNAVGGGVLYLKLGVGGCSYDASTTPQFYLAYVKTLLEPPRL
jgi:hypothetical protein